MANGKCRMHGGASPGAPRGEGNGMWRHRLRSTEAIERRRTATAEMRKIQRGMRELVPINPPGMLGATLRSKRHNR